MISSVVQQSHKEIRQSEVGIVRTFDRGDSQKEQNDEQPRLCFGIR